MSQKLELWIEEVKKKHGKKKIWTRAISLMMAFTVFTTTYALILPALTMEKTFCGIDEHVHSVDNGCYTENKNLVCAKKEGEAEEEGGHIHEDGCYEEKKELICELIEEQGHTHSEGCYDEEGNLTCTLEEGEGHTHGNDCYETQKLIVCGQQEANTHKHDDSCYETVLEMTCQKEEHEHTEGCYCNPDADIETEAIWQKSIADVELTGVWSDDVLAIADSQLGYKESVDNFKVEEGTRKGYTRYGAWYGNAYGDWCAMFVSFCLNYAKVDRDLMPIEASCPTWVEKLEKLKRYHESGNAEDPAAYMPKEGDLIFFDWDDDGKANHVGLVYEKIKDDEGKITQIKTIEGNSADSVRYNTYDLTDKKILGYGTLPENPATKKVSVPGPRRAPSRGPAATITNYYINGLADTWVVVGQTYNAMTGVSVHVEDEEGVDITGSSGCSIAINRVRKFDTIGETEDTTYTWNNNPVLDTAEADITWVVEYVIKKDDGSGNLVNVLDSEGKIITGERKVLVMQQSEIKDQLQSDDEYIISAYCESISTGTMPFDTEAKPGNDTTADDNIVRSFDSVMYTFNMSSYNYTSGIAYKEGNVRFRFVLPYPKEKAEFDPDSMGWMNLADGYMWQITEETIDGVPSQVLTCARNMEVTTAASTHALPVVGSTVTLAVNVKGMANNEILKPKAYAWMDYNETGTNGAFNKDHVCSVHNRAEVKEIALPDITVSAAPKYNVEIIRGIYNSVFSTFDFSTGNGNALNKDAGMVKGDLQVYGVALLIQNDNPSKKFKGIELPDGSPMTVQLDLSAVFNGRDKNEKVIPLLWSVDENIGIATSPYDGRAWGIGHSATDALEFPSNRGRSSRGCANGGTWTATQTIDNTNKTNVVTLTISDYTVDMDHFPTNRLSGGYLSGTEYSGYFSVGKLAVVVPHNDANGAYLPEACGSGTMTATVFDKNFTATSLTGQTVMSVLGREQTIYDVTNGILAAGEDKVIYNYELTNPGGYSQAVHYNGEGLTAGSSKDFNNIHWNEPNTCYYNGQDVGTPGQKGSISWGYSVNQRGNLENNLYAINALMLCDAEGLKVTGSVSKFENIGPYNVNFLYAAKKDGTNWTGIQEMNDIRSEDLVYYSTLAALEADGKLCIGVMAEGRAPQYIMSVYNNGNAFNVHVEVRDTATTDKVYPTIIKNTMWWKKDTDAYAKAKGLSQVSDDTTSTGLHIPSITNLAAYREACQYAPGCDASERTSIPGKMVDYQYGRRPYTPSFYVDGNYAGGHEPATNYSGDSLYIVPHTASIAKNIDQKAASGEEKSTFDLDYNQNIVDFRLTPAINVKATFNADKTTTVTIVDTIPQGVEYKPGESYAVIGGTYTPSARPGYHGSMTADAANPMVDLKVGGNYKGITCKPLVFDEAAGTLTFVFENVPYGKQLNTLLGDIHYSAYIESGKAENNTQYLNTVTIETTEDQRPKLTEYRNLAELGFRVSKLTSLSVIKTPDHLTADNNTDVGYTINVNNLNAVNDARNQILMDTMPKPASGTYTLKAATFTAPKGKTTDDYSFYYTTDAAGLEVTAADYCDANYKPTPAVIEASANGGTADPKGVTWKKIAVTANGANPTVVKFPANVTAWCAIGDVPKGGTVAARVVIVPTGAVPGTVFTNTFSVGTVASQAKTYIANRIISGNTWLDRNRDGYKDSNERVLAGLTVKLYKLDQNGAVPANVYTNLLGKECTTLTDPAGHYQFTALEEGKYVVSFTSGTTQLENRFYLSPKLSDGSVNTFRTSKADTVSTAAGGYIKEARIVNISMPRAEDLTENPYEWSNMNGAFYDEKVDLVISKKVVDAPADFTDRFEFTVDILNGNNHYKPSNTTYAVYKADGTEDKDRVITRSAEGQLKTELGNGEKLVILDIPEKYTAQVKETMEVGGFVYSASYIIDPDPNAQPAQVPTPLAQNEAVTQLLDVNHEIQIINEKALTDLTVKKTVVGDTDETFSFRLDFKEAKHMAQVPTDTNNPPKYTKEDKAIVFELKNGEQVTIPGVSVGAEVTVTETSHDGFTVAIYDITAGRTLLEEKDSAKVIVEDAKTIEVVNNPGVELPSTGGPGTEIYTISGLLIMASAAVYIIGKRRRRERRYE